MAFYLPFLQSSSSLPRGPPGGLHGGQAVSGLAVTMSMLPDPKTTVLGADPAHRTHALNGYAFQQDALTSCNGWQYAVFYSALAPESPPEPLFVHVARRHLPDGPWDVLVLEDYPQTTDDGHNTVQIGICAGDGTIHLSYDHHCDM